MIGKGQEVDYLERVNRRMLFRRSVDALAKAALEADKRLKDLHEEDREVCLESILEFIDAPPKMFKIKNDVHRRDFFPVIEKRV